jgi:hypothetical protein
MQENAVSHTIDLLNKMAPKVGMNFSSEAKDCSFYNKYYTKNVGFSKNSFYNNYYMENVGFSKKGSKHYVNKISTPSDRKRVSE